MGVGIIGFGKKLADHVVTNEDICKIIDSTSQWIVDRSGILERPVAIGQKSIDLATCAAKEALSGIDGDTIDLIIVATCTPDLLVPSMGSMLKKALNLKNAAVFDLNSACSGFIYSMLTAESIMVASERQTGKRVNRALVVGAERISRMGDWSDRSSCFLFGDGSGAVVLERREETGIIASFVKNYDDVDNVLRCGIAYPQNPFDPDEVFEKNALWMAGTQVFKFAVNAVGEVMDKALEYAGLSPDDVDLFVPHQANLRIIKAAAHRYKQPLEKFHVCIEHTGNISAATVPIALCEAVQSGTIKKGNTIMLVGFGGGLSAGAMLIKMW